MDVDTIREAIKEADAMGAARLRAVLNRGDPANLPPMPPAVSPAP